MGEEKKSERKILQLEIKGKDVVMSHSNIDEFQAETMLRRCLRLFENGGKENANN